MTIHPLLADTGGFAENMNRLFLEAAYVSAFLALLFAFLPFRRRLTRWFVSLFALGGILSVGVLVRENSPLPWTWVVLFLPAALSVLAVWLSWRLSQKGKRHDAA